MSDLPEKECEICCGLFTPATARQRYCPECGKNPERAKLQLAIAQTVSRRHAGDTYQVTERICGQCGKSFRFAGPQRFCSAACERQHTVDTAKCAFCGRNLKAAGILVTRGGRHWCSSDCLDKQHWADAEAAGRVRECQRCGKRYIAHSTFGGVFCSRPCYDAARAEGWRAEKEPIVRPTPTTIRVKCPVCGKAFERIYGLSGPACCSKECYQIAYERNRAEAEAARARKLAREGKRTISLCASCRVSYTDCPWMQSDHSRHPVGAVVVNGNVLSCPLFDEAEARRRRKAEEKQNKKENPE